MRQVAELRALWSAQIQFCLGDILFCRVCVVVVSQTSLIFMSFLDVSESHHALIVHCCYKKWYILNEIFFYLQRPFFCKF